MGSEQGAAPTFTMPVEITLYLASKTRMTRLSKTIDMPAPPRVGEHLKLRNAVMGDYFAYDVTEVTYRESGGFDVTTALLDNVDGRGYSFEDEQEFDEYVESYVDEGWRCHGFRPNRHSDHLALVAELEAAKIDADPETVRRYHRPQMLIRSPEASETIQLVRLEDEAMRVAIRGPGISASRRVVMQSQDGSIVEWFRSAAKSLDPNTLRSWSSRDASCRVELRVVDEQHVTLTFQLADEQAAWQARCSLPLPRERFPQIAHRVHQIFESAPPKE